MKKRQAKYTAAALLLLVAGSVEPAEAQVWGQFETGIAVSGYNDVRIPGDAGTLFSLSEELTAETTAFYRLRLGWTVNERHTFMLLAAPLQFSSTGSLDRDLVYKGVTFPAGTDLTTNYRFDSYRITWRRALKGSDRFHWGIGITGKIRSAAITVEGGGQKAEKPNVGPVPLINFALAWQANDRLQVIFEGDALAAPQGRAEDVLLGVRYELNEDMELYGGYRVLEGGADVDEVYTFALIHYASVGFRLRIG